MSEAYLRKVAAPIRRVNNSKEGAELLSELHNGA
jgi:hypothetical protein